jgi:D-amino peptidase
MKLYLMTDMEAVAGVLNHDDWCMRTSQFYEMGREFLTLETNAAIEGFFAGGATAVAVADGHGQGGINPKLLDPRAELMRGWPQGFPFGLDSSYAGIAWVGQHAKAGTEYSHITHTQWFNYIDLRVNGVSIGEFGQMALCAAELGVPVIFAAGEEAFAKEVQALTPWAETTSVKRGVTPGKGDEFTTDQYRARNLGAVHLSPERARALIRQGAERAARRLARGESFGLIPLKAPFEMVCRFRPNKEGEPRTRSRTSHPTSVIALLNTKFDPKPE